MQEKTLFQISPLLNIELTNKSNFDDLHSLWFIIIENSERNPQMGFITKHSPRFEVIWVQPSSSEPLQAKGSMKQKGPKTGLAKTVRWQTQSFSKQKRRSGHGPLGNRRCLLKRWGTYLDDVAVFDNLSQELLVLWLILLLLQFSGMLRERETERQREIERRGCSRCADKRWEHQVDDGFINLAPVIFWTGPPVCCCFPVCPVLPSRTASVPSICSWDTPWRGNLGRREKKRSNKEKLVAVSPKPTSEAPTVAEPALLSVVTVCLPTCDLGHLKDKLWGLKNKHSIQTMRSAATPLFISGDAALGCVATHLGTFWEGWPDHQHQAGPHTCRPPGCRASQNDTQKHNNYHFHF